MLLGWEGDGAMQRADQVTGPWEDLPGAASPCVKPGLQTSLNGRQDPVLEATPSLDLSTAVAGIDTTVLRYTQCPRGGVVELWTVNGTSHAPTDTSESRVRLVDWLLAHPKP